RSDGRARVPRCAAYPWSWSWRSRLLLAPAGDPQGDKQRHEDEADVEQAGRSRLPHVLLRALEGELVHERDRRVVAEARVGLVERVDDREAVEDVDHVEHRGHEDRRP